MVFNEFGFTPGILNRLVTVPYFHHNVGDIYDPSHPTLGNTNLKCTGGNLELIDNFGRNGLSDGNQNGSVLDWLFVQDLDQDVRMGFIGDFTCNGTTVTKANTRFNWPECKLFQISPISERPICYSTEALKYAQTASFFAIVLT